MFSHDPFQAYQNVGAIGANPYGGQYPGIHPLALAMQAYGVQPFGNPGIGGYGHLQGYQQQTNPWQQQTNPWQQQLGLNPMQHQQQGFNPLQQQGFNPLQQQLGYPGLQNPLLNPLLAYQAWQQQLAPFQYPLQPQTFIGAGGIGQPYGQLNPLAQLALRQAALGVSPFAGY